MKKGSFILVFVNLVAFLPMAAQPVSALNNGLARTPPMGWANWNGFGCHYNAATIKSMADLLVSTGMKAAGYRYVLIQECIAKYRDRDGNLIPNPKKFPHGMKAVVDYIHSKGLKAGIYTDVGSLTCAHYEGSFGHEQQDTNAFAAWGMDLVEEDFCDKPAGFTAPQLYRRMRNALARTGRPMVFYICDWGKESPWLWGPSTGNLWRTGPDITRATGPAHWKDIVRNFDLNALHPQASGPGGWNDPDMLCVGIRGITDREARSQFSLWAISAAPLLAGMDLRRMTWADQEIFLNREVIAVDQDPLGIQGRKVREDSPGLQVWSKRLAGAGTYAVVLFNRTPAAASITVRWKDIGLGNESAKVRDLWSRSNLGSFRNHYTARVPSHGVVMLRITWTART